MKFTCCLADSRSVRNLIGNRTWISWGRSRLSLRQKLLTALFLGLVADAVLSQNVPPAAARLTSCEDAIKVANVADGQLPRDQMVQFGERAIELCKQELGSDHQLTLESMSNLAVGFHALGRYAEALRLNENVLRLRRSNLGPDHPSTLDSMNNLGNNYADMGRHVEALKLREELVAVRRAKWGADHSDTLTSMSNLAISYAAQGRTAEALSLFEETLAVRRLKLGPDHPDTMVTMNNLAISYADQGRTAEALRLFEETLTVRRSKLGPDHPDTVMSMNNLANSYSALGRQSEALKLRVEALALHRLALGREHPDTLSSMYNLANSYTDLGRSIEALTLNMETLALRRAKLGAGHPATLHSMNNLANTYSALGRYTEALKLHDETLALRRAELGPDHPDTLDSMNNLANSYGDLGRNTEALKLNEETLALKRAKFGPNHPATLDSMNNLAISYSELGRHAEALKLYEEAVAHRRTKLGPDHSDTLGSMNNLALGYGFLGRHAEALRLNEEVLSIRRVKLREDHPDMFPSRNNLALNYSALGRHTEALKLLEETLRLQRGKLGADHPHTLRSMNAVAVSYSALGRYTDALKLNEEARTLMRAKLGPDHPETLVSMSNLAVSYLALGRYQEASKLNRETLELKRAKLGPDHPETLLSLNNLAVSYAAMGRLSEIPPLAATYMAGAEKQRIQSGLSTSDRQAIFVNYADGYRRFGRYLGKLGATQNRPTSLEDGFELSDLSKGRTLLESVAGTAAIRGAALPAPESDALQRLAAEISALAQAIAQQDQLPTPVAETLQHLRARARELDARFAALRERLKIAYPKYAQLLNVKVAKAADARRLLGSDQIALSFTLEAEGNLAAWLLDSGGAPRFVDLGEQAGLKDTIAKLRTHLSGEVRLPAPAEEVQLLQSIADILLKPLLSDPTLGLVAKKRWIIIPDGDLALLPFDTLPIIGPDGKTRPLIDMVEVSIVQSWSVYALLKEREAVYNNLGRPKSLFAMGNAVYDSATHRPADAVVRTTSRVASRGWSGADYLVGTRGPSAVAEQYAMQNLRWENLPGTALEVEAVAKVFPSGVDKHIDSLASEANLQELNKAGKLADYRYLLFSAHGYLASNPTLTSLVLSLEKPTPEADGYVTVAEWPAYNFRSDLIVLSACDTGVGKTLPGEGVMGLPYALFVAGNKNALLTLWPVADEATAEFMTRFFTRLRNGESQVAALTAVKREFAADPVYSAPRYWAAFVLYGV